MDKIKEIKRRRTPEAFLIDLIDGMTIREQDKYTDSVFWEKDGVFLFEQDEKNGRLWVSDKLIWSVFETKFGYNYAEIQSLIKNVVEEHTKFRGLTPRVSIWRINP